MCWKKIAEALTDPTITDSMLLNNIQEQSGDSWPLCDKYFTALVTSLFPKDFDYQRSQLQFSKQLQTFTGMSYNEVRNMTAAYFVMRSNIGY
jgi:hypothetical protein